MKVCTPALHLAADSLPRAGAQDAFEQWLVGGELSGWSVATLRDRRVWIRRLQDYLRATQADLSADSLRSFFLGLQKGEETHSRKPLRPASVKHVHSLLSAFCAWCVEEGLLESSPMKRVPPPIVRDDPARPFTPDEVDRLLRAASDSRNGTRDTALLYLLADTGLRAGELCDLHLADVNITAGTALVRNGKGGKSRQVAFGKATAQVLWRYLREQARDPHDPLFLGQRGEKLSRGALTQLCRRIGAKAGVERAHPHRFRHHSACLMLRNGMHVFAVMAQLGHSRVQVTERYVRLAASDVLEAHRSGSPMDNHKRRTSGRK